MLTKITLVLNVKAYKCDFSLILINNISDKREITTELSVAIPYNKVCFNLNAQNMSEIINFLTKLFTRIEQPPSNAKQKPSEIPFKIWAQNQGMSWQLWLCNGVIKKQGNTLWYLYLKIPQKWLFLASLCGIRKERFLQRHEHLCERL